MWRKAYGGGGGQTPKQVNQEFDCTQKEYISDFVESKKDVTCHCEGARSATAAIQTNEVGLPPIDTGLPRSRWSLAMTGRKAAFTRLVKPFRSDMDSPVSPSAQSGSQSSQTKCRNCVAHSYGFTLAETLITLTILGVVAAITVPSLINKQIESANISKVKKAMAVYEKAINQMIIDEDVKGSLNTVEGFKTTDNCSKSRPYFKTVENGDNDCQFKTADRVWWDITDIENPIIAFAKGDLIAATAADANTKKAFYLIGRRDDSGILRINDKGYEDSITSGNDARIAAMLKLYNFINKVETTSGGGQGGGTTEKCSTTDNVNYTCTGSELTWTKTTLTAEEAAAASVTNSNFCIWDGTTCTKYADNTSRVPAGDLITSPIEISPAEAASACSGSRYDAENGAGSCVSDLGYDYQEAARRKCAENGAHLATAAELKALKAKNDGTLDSDSEYWAAEAYSSDTFYAYRFNSYNGGVYDSDVYINGKAVCVGN